MSKQTKKYLVSSLITFFVTFSIMMLASWETITLESIENGAIWSLIFAAARGAVKVVVEAFVAKYSK